MQIKQWGLNNEELGCLNKGCVKEWRDQHCVPDKKTKLNSLTLIVGEKSAGQAWSFWAEQTDKYIGGFAGVWHHQKESGYSNETVIDWLTLKGMLIRVSPLLTGLLLIGWLAQLLVLLRQGADRLNRFKMSYIGYLFPWLQNNWSFSRSMVVFSPQMEWECT